MQLIPPEPLTGYAATDSANVGQPWVANDPVTGAANMLYTNSGIQCANVDDGIDNPVALLTDYKTAAYTYTFDPYGLPTLSSGGAGNGAAENPYMFKNGVQDRATGFVKFGQRWYNTATGSWTQQDTMDSPLDPHNANRYAYAGDDPVNNIDASGYFSAKQKKDLCRAEGIVAAGAGIAGTSIAAAGLIIAAAGAPAAGVGGILGAVVAGIGAGVDLGAAGLLLAISIYC